MDNKAIDININCNPFTIFNGLPQDLLAIIIFRALGFQAKFINKFIYQFVNSYAALSIDEC